jgi:hypothetical protein
MTSVVSLVGKTICDGHSNDCLFSGNKNEDVLRCPADGLSCGGIESASDNTTDKRNALNQVHRASGASFRNEPKTDSLIYTLQNLAGYPEDHLSRKLGPDIDTPARFAGIATGRVKALPRYQLRTPLRQPWRPAS